MNNINKDMLTVAPFVLKLIKHYGYIIQEPSRNIAKVLGISFMTVIKYLKILEDAGCITVERPSRKQGNIYKLKKNRINRLINDYNADIEISKILANVEL